jgi:hypothetical protein
MSHHVLAVREDITMPEMLKKMILPVRTGASFLETFGKFTLFFPKMCNRGSFYTT